MSASESIVQPSGYINPLFLPPSLPLSLALSLSLSPPHLKHKASRRESFSVLVLRELWALCDEG